MTQERREVDDKTKNLEEDLLSKASEE